MEDNESKESEAQSDEPRPDGREIALAFPGGRVFLRRLVGAKPGDDRPRMTMRTECAPDEDGGVPLSSADAQSLLRAIECISGVR